MFNNLNNIKEINLSNFQSKNVISMKNMFDGCSNLIIIDQKLKIWNIYSLVVLI